VEIDDNLETVVTSPTDSSVKVFLGSADVGRSVDEGPVTDRKSNVVCWRKGKI
jgi:hypothetical protein